MVKVLRFILHGAILCAISGAVLSAQTTVSGSWNWTDTTSRGQSFGGTMTISQSAPNGTFSWTWTAGWSGTGASTGSALALSGRQGVLTANWVGDLDPTGTRIVGTWTQSDGQVGTFTATRISSIPQITITTTSLQPGFFLESNYNSTLAATGGTPPYTWASSPLPSGLSLVTNVGGSAQLSGTFASDAENTASDYFPAPSASPSPASFDRVNRQFTITFTVSDSNGIASSPKKLTLPWTCVETGVDNSPDAVIEEYIDSPFGPVLDSVSGKQVVPRCMDITRDAHTLQYGFAQLNRSNLAVPGVALLSTALLYGTDVSFFLGPPLFHGPGLDGWVENYGSTPVMTSGYRPPEDQQRVYDDINSQRVANGLSPITPPPGGRHMFGDAVDLVNSPQTRANFDALTNAALDAGASFTEANLRKYPCSRAKMQCVHADWRGLTASYAQ